MRSEPVRTDAPRQRAEGQFKDKKKTVAETPRADDALKQTEAAKTLRLRALRLAKEAADRDTANRDPAAAISRKNTPRRHAPRPQVPDVPEPT